MQDATLFGLRCWLLAELQAGSNKGTQFGGNQSREAENSESKQIDGDTQLPDAGAASAARTDVAAAS